jgi:hypothetical protein
MLGDSDGLLRVVLWNEKAELVEKGELKSGQTVKFLHGYTRDDRYGKTELHLGDKSLVELQQEEKGQQCPPIEKFTLKISALNGNSGNVHVCGAVKAVLGAALTEMTTQMVWFCGWRFGMIQAKWLWLFGTRRLMSLRRNSAMEPSCFWLMLK